MVESCSSLLRYGVISCLSTSLSSTQLSKDSARMTMQLLRIPIRPAKGDVRVSGSATPLSLAVSVGWPPASG